MLRYPNLQKIGTSKKLSPYFKGPYKIIKYEPPLWYTIREIEKPHKIQRVHVARLRRIEEQAHELNTLRLKMLEYPDHKDTKTVKETYQLSDQKVKNNEVDKILPFEIEPFVDREGIQTRSRTGKSASRPDRLGF